MGIVAARKCEPLHGRAVRLDGIDFIVAVSLSREHDQVAAWRPEREVVVPLGQRRDGFRSEIHDSQAIAFRPERSVDEPLAVGRHRWEPAVVRPCRHLVKTAAVRINDRDLSATLGAVLWFQKKSVKPVEERVENADAEDNLVAAGRPLRCEDVAFVVVVDHLEPVIAGDCQKKARAQRICRRTAVHHKTVTLRTERRQEPGERQVVIGIAAERFLPRRRGRRQPFVKHDAPAVRRPRRRSYIAPRSALATRVVDAGAGAVLADVTDLVVAERRRIHFDAGSGRQIR